MTLAPLAAALLFAQAPGSPPAGGAFPVPTSPPLAFQARAEKREVRLGQPFGYEIEVRHPRDVSVSLPEQLPEGPFRLEPGGCRREEANGEVDTTCSLRASLFALGPNDLPEIELLVTGPQGKSTLKVPGPPVTGLGLIDPSTPPEKLALRDLAPPAPLFVRSLRLVYLALGLMAMAAAALVAMRMLRRAGKARLDPPVPLPPHELFARRLDELEAARLGEGGHAREHFYRLSEMLREYLGALLGAPALDLTTEELIAKVRSSGDPRLEPEWLRPFLGDVDLVKFARAPAGPGECASSLAFGRSLLARTRPLEPTPAQEAAAADPGRTR